MSSFSPKLCALFAAVTLLFRTLALYFSADAEMVNGVTTALSFGTSVAFVLVFTLTAVFQKREERLLAIVGVPVLMFLLVAGFNVLITSFPAALASVILAPCLLLAAGRLEARVAAHR